MFNHINEANYHKFLQRFIEQLNNNLDINFSIIKSIFNKIIDHQIKKKLINVHVKSRNTSNINDNDENQQNIKNLNQNKSNQKYDSNNITKNNEKNEKNRSNNKNIDSIGKIRKFNSIGKDEIDELTINSNNQLMNDEDKGNYESNITINRNNIFNKNFQDNCSDNKIKINNSENSLINLLPEEFTKDTKVSFKFLQKKYVDDEFVDIVNKSSKLKMNIFSKYDLRVMFARQNVDIVKNRQTFNIDQILSRIDEKYQVPPQFSIKNNVLDFDLKLRYYRTPKLRFKNFPVEFDSEQDIVQDYFRNILCYYRHYVSLLKIDRKDQNKILLMLKMYDEGKYDLNLLRKSETSIKTKNAMNNYNKMDQLTYENVYSNNINLLNQDQLSLKDQLIDDNNKLLEIIQSNKFYQLNSIRIFIDNGKKIQSQKLLIKIYYNHTDLRSYSNMKNKCLERRYLEKCLKFSKHIRLCNLKKSEKVDFMKILKLQNIFILTSFRNTQYQNISCEINKNILIILKKLNKDLEINLTNLNILNCDSQISAKSVMEYENTILWAKSHLKNLD